jgi:Glycosyltransferases, probably involved in cell wall biogenesis
MDPFQSNIYLAEDRVLSLALVGKKNNNYLLRYVKISIAETDVPNSLADLIMQRRR